MEAVAYCRHCGNPALPQSQFCCSGCESVFGILNETGLQNFYQLKEKFQFGPPLRAPTQGEEKKTWAFLLGSEQKLYLEGIHCLGCLWVLEKLPALEKGILESRLDLSSNILSVKINPTLTSWPKVKIWIEKLGYRAKPIEDCEPSDRESLIRLGVAAFSAGNVMLLSISLYAGASGFLAKYFTQIAFLLAAPSLLYSAWPIYRGAFLPLRNKMISVDLPIALALLSGFTLSAWNTLGNNNTTYVDSLAMLVLLLLSSRLYLQKERERLLKNGIFLPFTQTESYEQLAPETKDLGLNQIAVGQRLLIKKGQIVPADGLIRSPGRFHFDLSFLTGESDPVAFELNDAIDAGAKVLSDAIEIEVMREPKNSKLASILKAMKSFHLGETKALLWADSIGRVFVWAILAASAFMFYLWPASQAIERALTLAIVTCPCILAFSIPLVYQRFMEIGARKGILWKNISALENLAKAKAMYLDKTGTLTDGAYSLKKEEYLLDKTLVRSAVLSLEQRCSHPIAKFLTRSFSDAPLLPVRLLVETPGLGVRGYIQGQLWTVEKGSAISHQKTIVAKREGEIVATFGLEDKLRPDSKDCIRELKNDCNVMILSGDHESTVSAVATDCEVPYRSDLSPLQKAEIVSGAKDSVMVGDGINDIVAFKAAAISIAVQGSIEQSLQNADLYLSKPGLSLLLQAREQARAAMNLVKLNFAATLSYNFVAASLVFAGKMNPLWAAILMPLSAATVSAITILSTGENK